REDGTDIVVTSTSPASHALACERTTPLWPRGVSHGRPPRAMAFSLSCRPGMEFYHFRGLQPKIGNPAVHSTIRNLHGAGSLVASKGRVMCPKETIACPGANPGSRAHSDSSMPLTVWRSAWITCGTFLVAPAARADDDIDQKAIDRARKFLKGDDRG